MRNSLFIASFALIAACGQSGGGGDVPKTEVDCLASKTVVTITEAIRDGTAAGTSAEELQAVPRDKTAEAVERLGQLYPGDKAASILVTEINYRLEMIQDALNNRSPDSKANQVMDETFELAESCAFGG
ncbi:MAG: hypothetical protein AAGI14_06880 [Pseudomonadota bacterium]